MADASEASRRGAARGPSLKPTRRKATPRKPLQARGRARYEAVLDLLESLLAESDWDDIGYYEIVERSGMPAASIYHFFPSKSALATALADRYFEHFREAAEAYAADANYIRWQDLYAAGIKASVEYYNSHPAAMKLILGSQPFLEIHHGDSTTNRIVCDRTVEALGRMYELPYIQDPHRKFMIAIAIVDAVWRTSFDEHGYITPIYEEESTRAVIAYLRTFLPEDLELKQQTGAAA